MAKSDSNFNPTSVNKVKKGRMVLLYAKVDGVDVHMASFFHEEKADYVTSALKKTYGIKVKSAEEEKPKKTAAKVAKKVKK